MFRVEERELLRSGLLEFAALDRRISGAAITGSGAAAGEDQWSDIDLAFGVGDAAALPSVIADWTARMYEQHDALDHLDVVAGAWIYRVFLLPGTLQVDLAFVSADEFRALAPSFLLMFGEAKEAQHVAPAAAKDLIGFCWLYAVHARTCIARGKFWQAEYMISGVRDHALSLACIRLGLSAVHGRGLDLLPREVTVPFEASLVRHLDRAELLRAFRVVVKGLVREIRLVDEEIAGRLVGAFRELCGEPR